MSEVNTLMEMDETQIKEHIISFGKFDMTKTLPNALIVWYRIHFSENNIYDTRRINSFMNHMAVVLEDEIKDLVQRDDEVKIKIFQMRDLINFGVTR